jgi:hypothetical protein
MQIFSFPPISHTSAEILILGTMPGEKPLQLNQYYGHGGERRRLLSASIDVAADVLQFLIEFYQNIICKSFEVEVILYGIIQYRIIEIGQLFIPIIKTLLSHFVAHLTHRHAIAGTTIDKAYHGFFHMFLGQLIPIPRVRPW